MEEWAEVRRLVLVEKVSQREVVRRTGLARDTVARMLMSEKPPAYSPRPKVGPSSIRSVTGLLSG